MFPILSSVATCLAGLPTTSAYGWTSFVTTLPAATIAYSPITTPQTIVAFAPMLAPFFILFGLLSS